MKNILALAIALLTASISVADRRGHDQGGGGTKCKEDVMTTYKTLVSILDANPDFKKEFPYLERAFEVLSPDRRPLVEIETKETAIVGCRLSENPLACAKPNEDILQINCSDSGWPSLDKYAKYKHLLHELFWWPVGILDNNYFYSDFIVTKIQALSVANASSPKRAVIDDAFNLMESLWKSSEGKPFLLEQMSRSNFYGQWSGFGGDAYESRGEAPPKVVVRLIYNDEDRGIFLPFARHMEIGFTSGWNAGAKWTDISLINKSSGSFVMTPNYVDPDKAGKEFALFEARQVSPTQVIIASLPHRNRSCVSFLQQLPIDLLPNRSYCSLILLVKSK